MGFYVRKSISVGPFRFGLSRSGVNLSAGVKGFRVGTGPRGNYVHMGVGGIHYRATIPRARPERNSLPAPSPARPMPQPVGQRRMPPSSIPSRSPVAQASAPPMNDIDSVAASDIVDSSSADLLDEINAKHKTWRLWPAALAVSLSAVLAAKTYGPAWLVVVASLAGAATTFFAYRRDLLKKTVVLFYDMDPALESAYDAFHRWAVQMAACSRVWHVEAEGRVADRKYNAGASHVVRRNPTFIRRSQPPYVQTNVDTIAIGVGAQVLHFFPDRLLIVDARGVGAVAYSSLRLTAGSVSFVEEGAVPPDATVIDRTWKYVNKKGGADRRFKENRQLPVCLYGELSIQSATGLNELLQLSRREAIDGFIQAIRHLGAHLPVGHR
jgi:hypothetical protein